MQSIFPILIYGRDARLLETRGWILERAGYRVFTATELSEVARLIQLEPVRLAVLCHTLSVEECERALALLRTACPQIETIVLTTGPDRVQTRTSRESVDALDGPEKLLKTVAKLAGSETAMPNPL